MKFNVKNKIIINYVIILVLLFVDSFGNGIRNVILPTIIFENSFGTQIFGVIATIQAIVSIFIILPQANFIKHYGEVFCLRLGVIINIIIYFLYSTYSLFFVSLGKFFEGFADLLMNSSLSKLVYDYSDDNKYRGRFRAFADITSNIGNFIAPLVIGYLFLGESRYVFLFVIVFMLIGLIISFSIKKMPNSINNYDFPKADLDNKEKFNHLYLFHLKCYMRNENVMKLTIPTFLFSCFDIFESLILGQFLLGMKGFTAIELAYFWTILSIAMILSQVPFGYLADKKRNILFNLSSILVFVGFLGIIMCEQMIFIMFFGCILYCGCIGYSIGMSVLFGNMTTKENRLSESEVYRMIRLIGSGLFSLIFSFVFPFNGFIVIFSMMILCFTSCLLAVYFNKILR